MSALGDLSSRAYSASGDIDPMSTNSLYIAGAAQNLQGNKMSGGGVIPPNMLQNLPPLPSKSAIPAGMPAMPAMPLMPPPSQKQGGVMKFIKSKTGMAIIGMLVLIIIILVYFLIIKKRRNKGRRSSGTVKQKIVYVKRK